MKKERISGKIIQDDIVVSFVCEDHHFTFVRIDNSSVLGMKDILKSKDGFIEGQTSEDKKILIFTNGDIEIRNSRDLYTWLYIVAKDKYQQLDEYDGIQFIDGALKSLFYRNSLEVSVLSGEPIKLEEDSIIIDINSNEIDKTIIRSVVSQCDSIREGVKIDNSKIELNLIFTQSREVRSTFQEEYNTILELCRFLAFRKYAAFDEVNLLSNKTSEDIPFEIGKCYIRSESEYNINRDPVRCITFNEMYPYLKKLFYLVRNRDEKKSQYFIDFIPETPKDFYRVTPELIRKVCTSAEFETKICKIPVTKNENFIEIKKKIKELIDQSKELEGFLTEKEYNYLKGSFDFLDGPLEERMKNLYDRFEICIERILKDYDIKQISGDEIHEMIKVRNGMSHGSAITSIDAEAYTAKAFMGIVYASVLSRCDCSDEEIKKWIDNGLLTVGDV